MKASEGKRKPEIAAETKIWLRPGKKIIPAELKFGFGPKIMRPPLNLFSPSKFGIRPFGTSAFFLGVLTSWDGLLTPGGGRLTGDGLLTPGGRLIKSGVRPYDHMIIRPHGHMII